jgi:hypothetical protein
MRTLIGEIFLAVLSVTTAFAGSLQLVNNGGFETGSLPPWYVNQNICTTGCDPWAITASQAHSGSFSAVDTGNIELLQYFTPVLVSNVADASFWIYTPDFFAGTFVTFYYSSYSSGCLQLIIGQPNQWVSMDVTSCLDSGQTLQGISFFGSDTLTIYIDDVSIVANTATPEPATFGLLGSGLALAFRVTRRRLAV